MKANSIFDIKRFGRLMAYDLRLNGTAYLLKLAAFTLLLFIWMLVQMRQNSGQFMWHPNGNDILPTYAYQTNVQGYTSSFMIGLILLATFIGTSFSGLGNKVARTLFLQLPASTMEKYLHPLLLRVVLGTGLFFLMFWMDAQLARLTYEHIPIGNLTMCYGNGVLWKPDPFEYSMIFSGKAPWVGIIFGFISLGAFLFACPLFFRKLQLLKSILVFFIGIFLTVCLFVLFSHLFYPGQVHGFNVKLLEVMVTKDYGNITLGACAFVYASWLFFLVIGFFRLKESTL